MRKMSSELYSCSLRHMHRAMKCLGIVPLGQHFYLKILCNLLMVVVISIAVLWRFSFKYEFGYDFLNDHMSRVIDLSNFVELMCAHFIIVMEILWGNLSADIQRQMEQILHDLRVHLSREVSLKRIRRYSMAIYGSLLCRYLLLFAAAVYNNEGLVYSAQYSELVILLRFSEFSLYSCVVLVLYQELCSSGSSLLLELHLTRFELWPLRRFTLEKLSRLQRIHGRLWQTIRLMERNFQRSLSIMLLKFFVDTACLPYWLYLSKIQHTKVSIQYYCAVEEFCKLMEIIVPCWLCSRCDLMQRKFRSIFYSLATGRRNGQLNAALIRMCIQLGQEKYQFSVGGFAYISTEMLGTFLFGVISYIVIGIQFNQNLNASKLAGKHTLATDAPV
ncbi:putative gustatory receptor 98a [Drosophila guanche]|uniref:Gustatory receptor n=1 Tax=Drosophila guanche TaxID=7266 RepID=A0A3B0JYN9_DROGU|nr:putative gustatory receptor 98a [Drosophila guanche]SPP80630.1 blast:Putative gustatory receptor 98a [Drosophila guanche]